MLQGSVRDVVCGHGVEVGGEGLGRHVQLDRLELARVEREVKGEGLDEEAAVVEVDGSEHEEGR